ncbi:hypothetical protein [Actinophytocola sp.]|uniref:hypothetical protein n=1 Tax=Actinophytocola sp. TaxID=1872138 RepID=UPI002D808FB4|nr:hypothetical protein [Actinophytocola sp.]HET9144036.1 hypothetical protein [Actinophytocola sp.]
MDLFGFKRRRAQREANARQRAAAVERATRTVQDRPAPPPASPRRDVIGSYPEPRRRHRPEADAPDHLNPANPLSPLSPVYPFSSNYADPTPGPDHSASHHHGSHDFGAAGSGLGFSGSDSGSSSSSYDSGNSSYGGE